MTGVLQDYPWGSTTVLPEFLGREPDGSPQAELWFGAHPSAPSVVAGEPLDGAIAADPAAVLGRGALERFGPRLPYLVKVLAAGRPLSLQAHPTRAQAEAGFAREATGSGARVFADDWPKPEMMVALGPVDALCGFREPAETYAWFERLGVDDAIRLVEPLRAGGAAELREVLGRLLRLTEADHTVIAQVVAAAAEDDSESARTAVLLDSFFPGDKGILAALLLNRLRLEPGQAVYLPPGNLHAYLSGSGVEVMANSDNTLRGGLTDKLVAVDVLLEILDFAPGRPALVVPLTEAPGLQVYPTSAPEFRLWRLEPETAPVTVPAEGAGRVVLVVDGQLELTDDKGRPQRLRRGQAAFCWPADVVSVAGPGTAFVAAPGI